MDAVSGDGDVVVLTPRAPSKTLWAAELPRALWIAATWWRHRAAMRDVPRGDGRPVLLIPGLFNGDGSMAVMRRYLTGIGYAAQGWGLGRNLGAKTVGVDAERLIARIEEVAAAGGPVTLVGVSLGGMLSRLAAQRRPDLIRAVVTVASPFAGPGTATNVWRAFEWFTGERLTDASVVERAAAIARPLAVPATAIWSRSDGLVQGTICHDAAGPAIEVRSPHFGVQIKPEVLIAVARVLGGDQPRRSGSPATV